MPVQNKGKHRYRQGTDLIRQSIKPSKKIHNLTLKKYSIEIIINLRKC